MLETECLSSRGLEMREGGGEPGLFSSSDLFRDNSGPLSLIQQATRMARRTGKAPKRKGTPTKCWFCVYVCVCVCV